MLCQRHQHSVTEHTASYESFARLLYSWANSHILPSSLAITLLRSLLTQIGEDALIFFASIWTSDVTTALRLAALRHAAAFIQAHAGESATDFQLVLPGVLIALQDETKLVREAGILVMRNILALLKNGAPAIYGLDTFYGSRSSQSILDRLKDPLKIALDLVQLLKHADLQRYLEALLAISAEISIDPGRLSAAQTNFLGMSRGKNRKDSR